GSSGELAKAFRSAGMSEADIQAWLKQFNEDSSPAEIKSAAETGSHMLDTRLGNIAESYNRGMNLKQPVSAESLLDAKSKEIHDRLLAGNPSDLPAAQQNADPLTQARDAIARGANKTQVILRLQKMGINTSGL